MRSWLTTMCPQVWKGEMGRGLGRVGHSSWEHVGFRGTNWIDVGTDVPHPLAQVTPSPLCSTEGRRLVSGAPAMDRAGTVPRRRC